jgi:protein-tyrosine-phosphatase
VRFITRAVADMQHVARAVERRGSSACFLPTSVLTMTVFLSAVRGAPDRLLHQMRRSSALDTLAHHERPQAVLVVCHGNICRSPFAAAILGALLEPNGIHVSSAGFFGPDRRSPAAAIDAARLFGVDMVDHRSTLLTPELVEAAQLVVVMDLRQAQAIASVFGKRTRDVLLLGDLDQNPIVSRAIRDPIDQAPNVYHDVYARIERCCIELARTLMNSRSPAGAR